MRVWCLAVLVLGCGKSDKPGNSITLMGSGSATETGSSGVSELSTAPAPGSAEVPLFADAALETAATGPRKLVIGGKTTCVLLADATVRCWGHNEYGQVGNGTTKDAPAPVSPKGLAGVADLVVTETNACALGADGTVACWGKLADRGRPVLVPTPLPGVAGATRFVGDSCVAVADDSVTCWRAWPFVDKPGAPQVVAELAKATAFVDGGLVAYTDGTVKRIARDAKQLIDTPLTGAVELAAHVSDDVYCGRFADGTVKCFGNSARCKLGVADPIMSPLATGGQTAFTAESVTLQLPPARELALDAGENLCAVTNDNRLACVDVGDATGKRCGKLTSLLESVRTVDGTCALLGDGSVNCWIWDASRRRTLVAAIADLGGATQIAVGSSHGCAVTTNGVACWGSNDRGQLGRGAVDKTGHAEARPVAF